MKDLVEAGPAIGRVMETKLPAKVAYRLSRIQSKINSEMRAYTDSRMKSIKELGKEDPVGSGVFQIKDPESIKKFQDQMDELDAVEVKIDREPIKLAELGDVMIDAASLAACERFIIE